MSLLDRCLSLQLGRAWRLASRAYVEPLRPYALTPTQLLVLLALYEADGSRPTDLARTVFLDKATLTGILDRLERRGYVHRGSEAADARVQRVWLTERSQSLQSPLTDLFQQVNGLLASRLGPDLLQAMGDAFAVLEDVRTHG